MTLNLTAFAWFHTILSLIALIAGVAVILDLLKSKIRPGMTALYLATAVATNVTGFMFSVDRVLPSHIVGALSSIALIVAIAALYGYRLEGVWRRAYLLGATIGVYFLAFVTIAQAFAKVNSLRTLAPTQSEPPFAIAQLALLAVFVFYGWIAWGRFRGERSIAA